MLIRIVNLLIAIGLIALVFLIASTVFQIILFFMAIGVAIWLLRKIPFVRGYTDAMMQDFIDKKMEQAREQGHGERPEKDITGESEVVQDKQDGKAQT